jgi:putative alpha-1,2-mannosidase
MCYTLGNSLHWTYFAPHDPKGLISLFKSPQSFNDHLTELMVKYAAFVKEVAWAVFAALPAGLI